MYRMLKKDKMQELFTIQKSVFTASDLAVLWGISNNNTLWTTIKRYRNSQLLYQVYKGVYSKVPLAQVNKYELACTVMGSFSYISLETILYDEGIIMQSVNQITLVGEKNKQVTIQGVKYVCKSMKRSALLNRVGIEDNTIYSKATINRAVADILYYKPKYYLDNTLSIDFALVEKIKKEVF